MCEPVGTRREWESRYVGPKSYLPDKNPKRLRHFDIQKFLSHDPLDYIDLYNLYGFASYDGINGWDPYGTKPKELAPTPAIKIEKRIPRLKKKPMPAVDSWVGVVRLIVWFQTRDDRKLIRAIVNAPAKIDEEAQKLGQYLARAKIHSDNGDNLSAMADRLRAFQNGISAFERTLNLPSSQKAQKA